MKPGRINFQAHDFIFSKLARSSIIYKINTILNDIHDEHDNVLWMDTERWTRHDAPHTRPE